MCKCSLCYYCNTQNILSTKENCKFRTRQLFIVYYFNLLCYWINKGNLCFSLFHSTRIFTGSNQTSFCHVTHTHHVVYIFIFYFCCRILYLRIAFLSPLILVYLTPIPDFSVPKCHFVLETFFLQCPPLGSICPCFIILLH